MSEEIQATVLFRASPSDLEGKGLVIFWHDGIPLAEANVTFGEHGEYLPATEDGWRHKAAEVVAKTLGVRPLAVYRVELRFGGPP